MKRAMKMIVAGLATIWATAFVFADVVEANTFPPTPTSHFYGDADGNTIISGLDVIQVNNYVLSKANTWDTLQPSIPSQTWNTCDIDSDRLCSGLDAIQFNNYVLSKPVTIGATPWILENDIAIGGLDLTDFFYAEVTVPFSINLYSTHAVAGISGRPGISVVVEIDSVLSTTTGYLNGRDCAPVAGSRDQAAPIGAQCALAVTITDWAANTGDGPTEGGAFGLAVTADTAGDIYLNVRTEANLGLDLPATALTIGPITFDSKPTFTRVLAEIFEIPRSTMCTNCHVDPGAPKGLRLDSANAYTDMVGVVSSEMPPVLLVAPFDSSPTGSYLVAKIIVDDAYRSGNLMPRNGPPYLTAAEIDLIQTWIDLGALND